MNKGYLEVTMKIPAAARANAGEVYSKYKGPFLRTVPGAESKELLLRSEDVQVLHRFDSRASAESYLRMWTGAVRWCWSGASTRRSGG